FSRDWSSDVCSSDLLQQVNLPQPVVGVGGILAGGIALQVGIEGGDRLVDLAVLEQVVGGGVTGEFRAAVDGGGRWRFDTGAGIDGTAALGRRENGIDRRLGGGGTGPRRRCRATAQAAVEILVIIDLALLATPHLVAPLFDPATPL